jgi:hypothetical protein
LAEALAQENTPRNSAQIRRTKPGVKFLKICPRRIKTTAAKAWSRWSATWGARSLRGQLICSMYPFNNYI